MKVKNLSNTSFEILMECFFSAFENYFVPMPTDINYYKARWEMSKVDFNFSYGMFVGEKLVGFIIHAVDDRNDERIAFNTGTGVLANYRGNKIIKKIYAYALPDLIKNGFTRSSLEVICENEIAVKSYTSIGFKKTKKYLCFAGEFQIKASKNVTIKEINYLEIDWNSMPNQESYSWDNQKETLNKGNYAFYEVYQNDYLESIFVIDPTNGYLSLFEVLENNPKAWEHLFMGIQQISTTIKINNVDDLLASKINFLHTLGLKNTVNQYEMELSL